MSTAIQNLFPGFPDEGLRRLYPGSFERDWERLNYYHGEYTNNWTDELEFDADFRPPEDLGDRINRLGLTNETESWIEYHMMRALLLSGTLEQEGRAPVILRAGHQPIKGLLRAQIIPQLWVGGFRLDLAVCYWRYGSFARIAVECDGAEFHCDNMDQVNRDKRRDRILMQNGWPVLRFTGSEIAAGVIPLSDEVGKALDGLQWDIVTAYRAGLAELHRKQRGLSK
ncbi:endonuclease domain-containing protein [Hyphomonas sp. CY54-11-8]|jgi:very-short-patch-repair endonuclease|uniref:endonuclease domain-containing protein n=1 Tax=Hyphomonas sp. CY54-11-8 TaxID=1280944 RepID=UPI0004591898|nr:DUF559 domain-containing protein [Hyphomonas sp. CY54-11-8]KCZ47755.1 hypothetical protein HY17_04570 [Hyphomonas sp. CY54-11-8]